MTNLISMGNCMGPVKLRIIPRISSEVVEIP